MTDLAKLKALAEAATAGPWISGGNWVSTRKDGASIADCRRGDEKFIAAANPAVVLGLIAENERLHESDQEATELCDTLSVLLGEIAVAVRGPEEPKSRHGFHDLPSRVKTVVSERDQLKADNERLRADYAGLARFNPEWDRVAAAQDSVREHMAMVVQLKAEVAGLKTGYEAYERVNAELKAEVEGLRKDSESYRLLSFCHGQGTLELVRSHHELCAEIRRLKILAGEPVPQTPEEFVGPSPEGPTARIRRKLAALGKGEQS